MIEDYLTAKRIGSRHAGVAASEKTIKAYRAGLVAVERLLEMPIETITEDDADRLMYLLDEFEYANSYKANILAALRGFFSWAIALDRYKGSNPFAAIATPKASRSLPLILSRDQIDCLFAAITSKKYRLFFKLMYFGGLRIGEVTQLRRDDVANAGIIVRGKGDKQRHVYLPKKIMADLVRYMDNHNESDFVFYPEVHNGDRSTPITLAHAYKEFEKAKLKCGLPFRLRPHNLRHSSATHLHAATGDLATTQKFLGHASPQTTVIYAQITDSRLHDAQRSAFGD